MKRLAPLAVLGALLACGSKTSSVSWLTQPDLATHSARYFPVSAGDVHGPPPGQPLTTCNQCHADRSGNVTPPPPSASFATYTCTGCHVEIRPGVYHDDIAALATVSGHGSQGVFDPAQPLAFDQACRGCHPTGLAVDHALVFPLPHQDAAATIVAACADCHRAPTDRTVLGCAACHPHDLPATATAHAAVPDFDASATAAASALCVRCHGDGTVPVQVAAHAFPIGGGSHHSGASGGACLQCHPALRAAPKGFAADFAQPSCTGCHVSTAAGLHDDATALSSYHVAQGVADFQFTTDACLRCHPDGTGAAAPSYHADLFPIDAASKHAGIGCSSCHGTDRADLTQLKCASCHADPAQSTSFPTQHPTVNGIAILVVMPNPPPANCAPSPLPPLTSPDCLMCHARSNVDPVQSAGGHPTDNSGFGNGEHRGAGCLTCHTTVVTITAPATPAPAGYPAIDFSKPSNPSRTSTPGCVTCHSTACGNGN